MPMRVVAGTARGRQLKRVPGEGTRPIMDRVKEALFNILSDNIVGTTFLDLYAGTGSVGIEALSRGADSVVFVENANPAVRVIQENLALTGLAERARIVRQDVRDFLRKEPTQAFEYIYIAPPQYKDLWLDTLRALDSNAAYLEPDAIVIVQIDPEEQKEVALQTLVPFDERRYGHTLLWFFERPGD
ncbi:MAG TPA: 16S rRNA (guanine(966)-N(2))-methyltransferase RsmD [Aggregatilineales bacterium]|nr:16S rRNA (guanine(966)-N(2))-methyltransferase RsmD [Aggregatilineales bacterium]